MASQWYPAIPRPGVALSLNLAFPEKSILRKETNDSAYLPKEHSDEEYAKRSEK